MSFFVHFEVSILAIGKVVAFSLYIVAFGVSAIPICSRPLPWEFFNKLQWYSDLKSPCRYGPFWICTTLIFVAASIGTFVTYVAHKVKDKEWDYDINLVTWSAGLFYGYIFVVPLGLYVILKYFSVPSGLVQLLCLYGYSLFIFIPALVSSLTT